MEQSAKLAFWTRRGLNDPLLVTSDGAPGIIIPLPLLPRLQAEGGRKRGEIRRGCTGFLS